jgi:hypothetical protein
VGGIVFGFKKQRKIERLEKCLKELGVVYTKKVGEKHTSIYIGVNQPIVTWSKDLMPDKAFDSWLLQCDRQTLDLFKEEVFKWDGCFTVNNAYSSSVKKNVDWLQIVWALSRGRAEVVTREATEQRLEKPHYYLNLTKTQDYSHTTNFSSEDIAWDGLVYCLRVQSGYIVTRRNGKVAVTGNSQNFSKQEIECEECKGEGCDECAWTGKEMQSLRYCLGPGPGREWWSLDFKNIELRIPAYESGERSLIDLFERPDDPPYYGSNHLLMGHFVYTREFEEASKVEANGDGTYLDGRKFKKKYNATLYQYTKNGDFAIQYNCGEQTADRTYRVPGAFKKIKSKLGNQEVLNQNCIRFANKHGYVETLPDRTVNPHKGYPLLCSRSDYGRVKPTIPLNYRTQGTAMWCTTQAMIRCHEVLEQWREEEAFDGFICMQVHDELVFDLPLSNVHPSESEDESNLWRVRILQAQMESTGPDLVPSIPTPCGVEYHDHNWSTGVTFA